MPRSRRKEIEGKLGAWALLRAQAWLSGKPVDRAERFGRRMGRLLYRASKKHRDRADVNLRLAFPDLDLTARQALALRAFEHFGAMTADFLAGANRTLADLQAEVELEGLAHLDEALEAGRGVIMVTGHFGNWERMSALVSGMGYPLSVIARDTDDRSITAIVNRQRSMPGTSVIARGNSVKPILERLKRNELIGILPDQNATEIYIPFFGHPAGTVLGPGVLAERTGAKVICCFCAWIAPGKYRMTIEPPLTPVPGCTTKGEGTMRAIHRSLESIIRQYPEQWLWFHDRWRSARRAGLL